eukprot:gnl/Spiro4/27518_TR13681_c0_g1_i1.p1 gnl/Spiro4/27518_TR13681_c0_g1~~gnl/Spiro4/27518_TR13681_c0_g1_i1.p1  ORF type:complete len:309 (+),score=25.49 gnl/Spiro4/27518_TR13681_c0_g1_i1:54-980(+)
MESYTPTPKEVELFNAVNAFRRKEGLYSIPYSPALGYVAHLHCEDMENNLHKCSHGWSNKDGRWRGAADWRDGGDPMIGMWGKPAELTASWPKPFTGNGYECAHQLRGDVPASAIVEGSNGWEERGLPSRPHYDVLVNKGMWARQKWRSMGTGWYGDKQAVWFAAEADPNSTEHVDEPVLQHATAKAKTAALPMKGKTKAATTVAPPHANPSKAKAATGKAKASAHAPPAARTGKVSFSCTSYTHQLKDIVERCIAAAGMDDTWARECQKVFAAHGTVRCEYDPSGSSAESPMMVLSMPNGLRWTYPF